MVPRCVSASAGAVVIAGAQGGRRSCISVTAGACSSRNGFWVCSTLLIHEGYVEVTLILDSTVYIYICIHMDCCPNHGSYFRGLLYKAAIEM